MFGLARQCETPLFPVRFRRRIDQRNFAILAVEIKPAISVNYRAGAKAVVLPQDFPGNKLSGNRALRIRAVNVFADQDLPA